MKRLLFVFLPLLLLALAIGIPVSRVMAVDPVMWDLGTDSQGGVIPAPAGTATYGFGSFTSNGLESSDTPNGASYYFMQATWATEFENVDSIKLKFSAQPSPLLPAVSFDGTPVTSAATNGAEGGGWQITYYDMGGVSVSELAVYADLQYSAFTLEYIEWTFTDDEPPGPGGDLTFPIASEDAHEQWGTYDMQYVQDNDPELDEGLVISEFPNTVFSFSNDPEANVSAVADGHVISVTPYTGLDCSGAFVVFQSLRRCRVIIPVFITQETSAFVFNIELINLSLVVVEDAEDPDTTYTYWLADAVVDIGDEITAGCVLGKTVQLKNTTNFDIGTWNFGASGNLGSSGDAGISINAGVGGNFRSLLVDAGVTTVVAKVDGEPVQLYPLLSEEPTQDDCRTSALTNCILDNPDLQPERNGTDIELWNYSGGVTAIEGGGAHLMYNSFISQSNIAILPDIGYTLSVMARVTTPIDSFYPLTLRVGETTTTMNVTEGEYQPLVWELGPRETSTLSVVGVFNQLSYSFNSEFPVEVDIKYICFTPETADIQPGSCVFTNHQFDADGQGWLADGSVEFINGQVIFGDDGTIDQPLILLPDGDTPVNYTITAYVRLLATNAYTGQSGKEVELLYRFPESGDYGELGTIDDVLVQAEGLNVYDGTVNIEHVYILSESFEISDGTDGLFSFNVQVTDGDNYIRGLKIDRLCIEADTEDGSIPGQPGGGGFTPPFIERCGVVPTPQDNNISSWTYYHWKNLERFFNCTLMVTLNRMASTVDTAWKTTRLFMRWCVVLANRVGDSFTNVLWWLGGHFRNIAVGQVTTIYEGGGGSCSDLFCVLEGLINGVLVPINNIVNTMLGLLTTAANLLLTIVTGVLGLGLSFLTRLFSIFNQATGLLSGLIDAYNTAEPISIEGMPTCTVDPDSSMFCRMVWVMDNTAFNGRWGILFTVAMAILTIHLIIWSIGELRRAIVQNSASTA